MKCKICNKIFWIELKICSINSPEACSCCCLGWGWWRCVCFWKRACTFYTRWVLQAPNHGQMRVSISLCFAVLDSINPAWRTMRSISQPCTHSSWQSELHNPWVQTHGPLGQPEPQTHVYNIRDQFGAVLNLSTRRHKTIILCCVHNEENACCVARCSI